MGNGSAFTHGESVVLGKDSGTPLIESIGVPAVVTDFMDGLICAYHLALVKPRSDINNAIYLANGSYLLRSSSIATSP